MRFNLCVLCMLSLCKPQESRIRHQRTYHSWHSIGSPKMRKLIRWGSEKWTLNTHAIIIIGSEWESCPAVFFLRARIACKHWNSMQVLIFFYFSVVLQHHSPVKPSTLPTFHISLTNWKIIIFETWFLFKVYFYPLGCFSLSHAVHSFTVQCVWWIFVRILHSKHSLFTARSNWMRHYNQRRWKIVLIFFLRIRRRNERWCTSFQV